MSDLDLEMIKPSLEELKEEDIVSFYNSYYEALNKVKDECFGFSKDNLLVGDKTIYNKTIIERKEFDDGFVDMLKSSFPAFLNITRDPKRGLKYVDDVVGVEKAHKITSKSIMHLSSHTQFISKVEDDEVTPSKLLVTFAEEDLAMYENRAYKTLVNNIIRFLKHRQRTLNENLESHRYDIINFNKKTNTDFAKFDIDLNIKMTRPLEEDTTKAQQLLDNINALLDSFESLTKTSFMKALAKAPDVKSPLMKTNIFLHNPEFKILYNVWIFIERYSTEPYNVNINEFDYKNDNVVDVDLSKQSLVLIDELMYLRGVKDVEVENKQHLFENNVVHECEIKHDPDFIPGDFVEENFIPSETFLQKTLDLYKTEYENKKKKLDSVEVSARQTIQDMLKAVNSVNTNLFDYKDTDLDNLSEGNEEKYEAQKKRYLMLKTLREEKEIDLETTRLEEKLALEHLNDIEKKLNKELTEIEKLAREGMTNRYKARREAILKEREEAFERQKEVMESHREELLNRARERAIKIGKRGFHSKVHDKEFDRIKRPLLYFDNMSDDVIDIDMHESDKERLVNTVPYESKRDYSNTDRMTMDQIREKVAQDKRARDEAERAERERIAKEKAMLSHAFASKNYGKESAHNNKRARSSITIDDDTDTLDLSGKPKREHFMKTKANALPVKKDKPKKKGKFVGNKKTLVKKKKLEAQIRKTKSEKSNKPFKKENPNRKLISKKRVK